MACWARAASARARSLTSRVKSLSDSFDTADPGHRRPGSACVGELPASECRRRRRCSWVAAGRRGAGRAGGVAGRVGAPVGVAPGARPGGEPPPRRRRPAVGHGGEAPPGGSAMGASSTEAAQGSGEPKDGAKVTAAPCAVTGGGGSEGGGPGGAGVSQCAALHRSSSQGAAPAPGAQRPPRGELGPSSGGRRVAASGTQGSGVRAEGSGRKPRRRRTARMRCQTADGRNCPGTLCV